MTTTLSSLDFSQLSSNKWHTLCYELSVALETTFPADVEPSYSPEFCFRDLLHTNPKESVWRVSFPAVVQGNANKDGLTIINFVPWVDEEGALFHRICFRLQPLSRMTNQTRPLAFARFGEKQSFRFEPSKRGGQYINLNFLGYGQGKFEPVYLKVATDQPGEVEYYKISAEAGEETVEVAIEKVVKDQAPDHLKTALQK